MTALALRVFWVSLTTSLVLLPLLLCSGALLGRYRAKSCYVLWLLLAVRLLIPVEIPLPRAPVTVEVPAAVLAERGWENPGYTLTPAAPSPVPVSPALSVADGAAGVWLLGAAAVLCFQCECYFTARKGLLKAAREREEDQLLLAQLGGAVPVLRAPVDTPMTLGLLRPVVLLPRDFPEEDLPLVLRHELCHLRRGDLWYKLLFLLCAALHWFNPLVWKLTRVAGETVELCCDGDVVAGQDIQFRRQYGQVILRGAAARTEVALATPFGSGQMKGRLMNLFVTKRKGVALVCAAACAALMMGSLVGCEAAAADPAPQPAASQSAPSVEEVLSPGASSAEEELWIWPVEDHYTLSALQGDRVHPVTGETSSHSGVDIPAETGTGVMAAADGIVLMAEFDKQYGNCVVLDHGDGVTSLYGHMGRLLVETGDSVEAGTHIGCVGQTGAATGPHLHFEVRQDGELLVSATYPGKIIEMTDGSVVELSLD